MAIYHLAIIRRRLRESRVPPDEDNRQSSSHHGLSERVSAVQSYLCLHGLIRAKFSARWKKYLDAVESGEGVKGKQLGVEFLEKVSIA